MESKPKCALYCRVSSQEQATEGVSIDAQQAALRAYAKSQGWEIFDEYVDAGFTGGTDERPALKRLLSDAGQQRFNIVAVCKLDRFFRNLRLLLNHLHTLKQLGIRFVSTQEGMDTFGHYGKFGVEIIGTIAEFERDRIGERVRDSHRYLVSSGVWPGGRTPYGYDWLAKERKWEIIPQEADVVRRIFDLYVNQGKGMLALSAILREEGVEARKGFPWRMSTVRRILVHPGYAGKHRIGVEMPPIIDSATWERAQRKRQGARNVMADPKGWLLQGMVFCGKCGHALKCVQKRPKYHRYYACRGRTERNSYPENSERCDLRYVRAEWLEREVWHKVRSVLWDKDALTECVNKAIADLEARRSGVGVEVQAIDEKLAAIKERKERLGIAYSDGALDQSAYKSKLNQLKKLESSILDRRHNIDPSQLTDLAELESRISTIKDIVAGGQIVLTELGIFALKAGEGNYDGMGYIPLGFNAGRETDGRMSVGELRDMDVFHFPDFSLPGIGAPPGIGEYTDPLKQKDINRNLRALMQFFGINVLVYPESVEIKGAIPTQMLRMEPGKKDKVIASIIPSP